MNTQTKPDLDGVYLVRNLARNLSKIATAMRTLQESRLITDDEALRMAHSIMVSIDRFDR